MPIHQVDIEIFQRINEKFDLLVALEEKSDDHQSRQDSSSGDHDLFKISRQSMK